nr:integrase, catalytic region, zinc finger, CCHC-type, peptidase aspartic, catalytic [Tanacetum cinerariifolium]
LKGKAVLTEAVFLNPIDPALLQVGVAPLVLKLRKNRTAHTDYIRHTQEEAATLRGIVESERLLSPLNTSLDYASQAQAKDTVILKLKEKLNSLNGDVKDRHVKRDVEEIETLNIELDHKVTKLATENEHLKQTYKQLYDSVKSLRVRSKEQCDDLINQVNLKSAEVSDLNASLQEKVLGDNSSQSTVKQAQRKSVPKLRKNRTAHTDYIRHTQEEAATLREIVESERLLSPLNTSLVYALGNVCPLTRIATPTIVPPREPILIVNSTDKPVVTLVVQIVLWYLDSGCSKHMTGDRSQLVNFVQKFFGTVKFGNDHVAKIMGYGDYQIGNVTISRLYHVEGLGHNLFSIGKFCDSDLEVAFRQHTCFIRNLDGVDLLTGYRGNNMYTLSIQYMMASSPICILSKASKTKSWLWHRRLSYLNFSAINHLAREGLVRVARSPQQNGVVERSNRTLIEAAHTMLIYAQAPLFLWAAAVATACFTQNRYIIRLRHGKTLYELLHSKLPDLSFFYVFGALYYPTNDSENLSKLQPKADIGIFIGYASTKKAFRIYNQRTRKIMETIHVDFDELTAMASEHR